MSELLLEILSEEIPARMQDRAADDLQRLVNERLLGAGFLPEGVKAFSTARRLALAATGLPRRQPDRREEKKGPRVGAPEKAVEGFLKSAGLSSLASCEVRDDKKGAYYVALVEEKGRETAEVIAGFMPEILCGFPWPKSMRWGDGDLRWVRPIRSILCVFGGEAVSFSIDGISASDETRGHRTMSAGVIRARNFEAYERGLKAGGVVLDRAARMAAIAAEAKTLCEAQALDLVEDDGLLGEVAGLAEWPVVLMGAFDRKFLALPDEVLTATMRGNQKYFSVKDPNTARLAARFVFVANIEAPDGGAAMRPGYERVLTARLSDAWFLYNKDLKRPLESRIADLDRVTFFEGLGTVGDKARRVAALAREIAPKVGADPQLAEQAALLAKADLTTGMVYEFPELQGIMGRYYYLAQHAAGPAASGSSPAKAGEVSAKPTKGVLATGSERAERPPSALRATSPASAGDDRAIADAIRDHYKPKGAEDDVPTAPVSVAVALADKLDTLTAFWAIGRKPTGSSDPFALRRAALGVIQTILENKLRMELAPIIEGQFFAVMPQIVRGTTAGAVALISAVESYLRQNLGDFRTKYANSPEVAKAAEEWGKQLADAGPDLIRFFHDRLKVYLRDKGHRHDHIDAVLIKLDGALEDDLLLIVKKLEALEAFLKTDDGANLAAAYKRAANILKAEEKKGVRRTELSDIRDGAAADDALRNLNTEPADGKTGISLRSIRPTDATLLRFPEEKGLSFALETAEKEAAAAMSDERFADAMTALAALRRPVDSFFDKVTVNDPAPDLRANRLALLARLRAATATVADLSKLEG